MVPDAAVIGFRDHPHDSRVPRVHCDEQKPEMPPALVVNVKQKPLSLGACGRGARARRGRPPRRSALHPRTTRGTSDRRRPNAFRSSTAARLIAGMLSAGGEGSTAAGACFRQPGVTFPTRGKGTSSRRETVPVRLLHRRHGRRLRFTCRSPAGSS
jgi:hypothetical protein